MHAMLAECLENALLLSEPIFIPASPIISSSPDNDFPLLPIANLCVIPSMPNTDLCEDAYSLGDIKLLFPFSLATIDFTSAMLVSLVALYNALLDSGCTHHIIRDHTLFCNYTEKAISVGTANCGSLEALGTGDVEFRHPYGD